MQCHGCKTEIVEGQHYMKVRIELATDFPPNLVMRPIAPLYLNPRFTVHAASSTGALKTKSLRMSSCASGLTLSS
jgi:hypothetical protein